LRIDEKSIQDEALDYSEPEASGDSQKKCWGQGWSDGHLIDFFGVGAHLNIFDQFSRSCHKN